MVSAEWLFAYFGFGAVIMTVVMGVHLTYQDCKRPAGYHVVEALLFWLIWPVLVIVSIVAGYLMYRRSQHDHERKRD